jgi:tetratricopeptide (TPR) repeat protein
MIGVRSARLLAAVGMLVLLAACATAPKVVSTDAAPLADRGEEGAFGAVLDLPPLLIEGTPDGWKSWTADQLFAAGNDSYDEGDWTTAVGHYDRIIRAFPDDDGHVPAALFNGALSLEHLQRVDEAEAWFAALIDRHPEHALATNAAWNLLDLREQRQAWPEVLRVLRSLRLLDLQPAEQLELDAREAIALAVLEPSDERLERLEALAVDLGRAQRAGQQLGRDVQARVFWTIGEIWLGRSQAVVVEPDGSQLERQLETKSEYLLRAQDGYLRTIRALDPHWATAAVFRIGFAYETFYGDLVNAPAPKALGERDREVYFEEVRRVLVPVRRKAEMAYERIIGFSRRYAFESTWVTRAEEHLARLRRLRLPGES